MENEIHERIQAETEAPVTSENKTPNLNDGSDLAEKSQGGGPSPMDARLAALDKTDEINRAILLISASLPKATEATDIFRLLNEYLGILDTAKSEDRADMAIPTLEAGMPLLSNSSESSSTLFRALTRIYEGRYQRLGQLADINQIIKYQTQLVDLAPHDHPDKTNYLSKLGTSHYKQHSRSGDLTDLDKAIEYLRQAMNLTPEGHSDMLRWLNNLGLLYDVRIELLGEPADIEKHIGINSQAISLAPDGHPEKHGWLSNIGTSYHRRFNLLGERSDIDRAIENQTQAVTIVPETHPDMPAMLDNVANSHHTRFKRFEERADLEQAIELQSRVVSLGPADAPSRPLWLSNLGVMYHRRFKHFGAATDVEKAIELQKQAVSLMSQRHPYMPGTLNSLGISYSSRFEALGELSDLEAAIECHTYAVTFTPKEDQEMPARLRNLGLCYDRRFESLGELPDSEKALDYLNQAMISTPEGHPNRYHLLNQLGNFLANRFQRFGQLEDIHSAISHQSRAISLMPEGHSDLPRCLSHLGNSEQARFEHLGDLVDLEQSLEHLNRSVLLTPDSHPDCPTRLNSLGVSHRKRFEHLGVLADIDKAIEYQSQAVLLTPAGHPTRHIWLNNLGTCYRNRFRRLGEESDITKAIESHIQAVESLPEGHPDRPTALTSLGSSYANRFEALHNTADINKAIEFESLAVSLTPEQHVGRAGRLMNLGSSYNARFGSLGDLEDSNVAIDHLNRALAIVPNGHVARPSCLNNLGMIYMARSMHLGTLSDIDCAIKHQGEAVKLIPEGHSNKSLFLYNLGESYQRRFDLAGEPDFNIARSIDCYREATESRGVSPSTGFFASRKWARLSFEHGNPSSLQAYQRVMEFIPRLIWLGRAVDRRYEIIEMLGDVSNEAAAVAIGLKKYDLALEWLEEGRSIVWSQMLQLRTPTDELVESNPELAAELKQIARGLDSVDPTQGLAQIVPPDSASLDQAAHQYRRLAEKWEALINQARNLPGFESFLLPIKASELVRSARSGPVVVINVHETRCDALVMKPGDGSVHHLPLGRFSRQKASRARSQLLGSLRRQGLLNRGFKMGHQKSGDSFEEILGFLWEDVVKPVLDFLEYEEIRSVEQLPHITWCPTGPLSFLPLHAAGDYRNPSTILHNLAISSYTPTLSALLAITRSTEFTGILGVAQAFTAGLSDLPGTGIELTKIQQQMVGRRFTRLESDSATPVAVLTEMGNHSWVHLACHATQNSTNPTQSAFYLHDGKLDLASITQKHLKHADLAFLSACQTATGDEKLSEEAVHLAAGMIMAGYPSVIATMWSIHDEDAPLIAEKVYAHLLEGEAPDARRAARGLHIATKHVREKVGVDAYARWVPYIHIGL